MANVYDHNYFEELREIVEYADFEKVTEFFPDQLSADFTVVNLWAVVGYNTYDEKVVIDYAEGREAAVTLCNLMVGEGEAHKAKIEAEYEACITRPIGNK